MLQSLIFIFLCFCRKRSFSGNQEDDCDLESTRDSVLSGNSQIYSDICDPDLMIIDFEYCAYNYRGFDLANHFVEWTIDYRCNEYPFFYHKKEQYPTIEQQVNFNWLTRRRVGYILVQSNFRIDCHLNMMFIRSVFKL